MNINKLTPLFNSFKNISQFLSSEKNDLSINDTKKFCNNILIDSISKINEIIGYIDNQSLEPKIFLKNNNLNHNYLMAFSALDGSKNLPSNISVGSIFSIYKYEPEKKTLSSIIISGYCLYGTKTILVISDGNELKEYFLNKNDDFEYSNNYHFSKKKKKIYAVNNSYSYDNDI